MKRDELLNAIEDLKDSETIESDIDYLKSLAVDFCDKYERAFNDINEHLGELAPHIEKVQDALSVSESCSSDLY